MKRSMNPERKRKRKRKRDKRRRTNTQNVSYAYSSAARREYVPKQSCCNTTILIYTFIHNRVRLNSSSPLPPSLLSSSPSSASLPSFPPPFTANLPIFSKTFSFKLPNFPCTATARIVHVLPSTLSMFSKQSFTFRTSSREHRKTTTFDPYFCS